MDASLISDNLTTLNRKHNNNQTLGLVLSNSPTRRRNFTPDQRRRRPEIRSQTLPIDAVAPPPVKPSTIPKSHARKRSRVKRRRKLDGAGAGADDGGFFGGDGPFGGGGGGNNGNSNGNGNGNGNGGGGFNEFNWGESAPSPSDPAFDFVYELLTWFVLSNCLLFAFKRVVRIVVDGSGDPGERRLR